jgi:hypothetical protein
MQRLAVLIQKAATARANDRFTAVNLGSRMPGMGRTACHRQKAAGGLLSGTRP